jgi:hypothetical protein
LGRAKDRDAGDGLSPMGTRHSEYDRDDADWYVEPDWTVDLLLDALPHIDALHDPCCGWGTIVACARKRGIHATGADITDRACGLYDERDFLTDERIHANIITNPPYRRAVQIIEHGLRHVRPGGGVAVFVPIGFLSSQRRTALHRYHCHQLLVLSSRPSVPPGKLLEAIGESARHSGSVDYCWLVYRPERRAPGSHAAVDWLVRSNKCQRRSTPCPT